MVKVASAKPSSAPLLVKFNDKWVNLEIWKASHPGGSAALDRYAGKDATDAFMSLHSKEAVEKLTKLKSVVADRNLEESCGKTSSFSLAFRQFRARIEQEGMLQRKWHIDAFYIGLMLFWCVLGYVLAERSPLLGMLFLGLGMQQAGWIGHDYTHGRGRASIIIGHALSGLINGFSRSWWSEKHNKHHVHPNQAGVDDDIANDPILHLYVPDTADNDFVFRPYQHFYYHFAYMFLYASWRAQSLISAYKTRNWFELSLIVTNYAILATLPLSVVIGSILIGGFLVAEIVTATHQSEDMLPSISHEFALDQFRTTRDVHMESTVANYLWGGMQYQLIHHLFPTMPRYYYPSMIPKIKQFASENGVEYRTAGAIEIFRMNYETMQKFAQPRQN